MYNCTFKQKMSVICKLKGTDIDMVIFLGTFAGLLNEEFFFYWILNIFLAVLFSKEFFCNYKNVFPIWTASPDEMHTIQQRAVFEKLFLLNKLVWKYQNICKNEI